MEIWVISIWTESMNIGYIYESYFNKDDAISAMISRAITYVGGWHHMYWRDIENTMNLDWGEIICTINGCEICANNHGNHINISLGLSNGECLMYASKIGLTN